MSRAGADVRPIEFYPHRDEPPDLIEAQVAFVREFLTHGDLLPVGNPHVQSFERSFAAYVGAEHAVGVGSGTVALVAALRALRLPQGAEALTSPFTYAATGSAIVHAGLVPRFSDISRADLQLDDAAAEAALGPDVAAVVPVHLVGTTCPVPATRAAAAERGIAVVDDSAQRLSRGCFAETAPRIACYSLGPTKNIAGPFEAGAIATDDEALVDDLFALVRNGNTGGFFHPLIGYNGMIDAMCAGILSINLERVDAWNEERMRQARRYDENLADVPGLELVAGADPACAGKYCVYVPERRDFLAGRLQELGIGVLVSYPTPLHLQPCFAYLGYARGDFPEAERAAAEILALPIHHGLTDGDVDRVCALIREVLD